MKAYLEPDDIKLMEDSASNLRDRLLIRLLFRLGCRVSEALALTTDDIDFDRGSVTIIHLKIRWTQCARHSAPPVYTAMRSGRQSCRPLPDGH